MSRSKRIKRIEIRLTPEELQLAETMAKNLQVSVSGLFRYHTFKQQHQPALCQKLAELNLQLKPIALATEQALWMGERITQPANFEQLIEQILALLKQVQQQQMNVQVLMNLSDIEESLAYYSEIT
ncbi:plasmid mobilization protein [Microcoleus sp. F4-D5]|uniref:plasmid mobilization protein n=1 Tax=Microcoleus sp. F4-D5 TaxID=2818760 RepID=UPI002FD1AEB9